MGARMTDDERVEAIDKLIRMQEMLAGVMEAADLQAAACKAANASGLGFAVGMVKEAIQAYSIELTKFVRAYIEEDDDE